MKKIIAVVFVVLSINMQAQRKQKIIIQDIQRTLTSLESQGDETINIKIPGLNSQIIEFNIHNDNTCLPEGLTKKYPSIKSFSGESYNGNNSRLNITKNGNRIFGRIESETEIIYFYNTLNDENSYSYNLMSKSDIIKHCEYDKEVEETTVQPQTISVAQSQYSLTSRSSNAQTQVLAGSSRSSATTLTTYTMAMTLAGAQAESRGITTVADGLAYLNTVLDGISVIYRRELQVEFQLHPNNDEIIFLDSTTDPYGVGNTNVIMFDQHNDLVDRFGADTFDVGMLVHPGIGIGWSGGRVCGTNKGAMAAFEGVFTHEVGHQFGCPHSSIYDQNNEIEAGAKSMVGNNWPYMHSVNFDIARDLIEAETCGITVATGNTAPTITIDTINGLTIPNNTPYTLEGTATDPDPTANLKYTWQQMEIAEDDPEKELLFSHAEPSETDNIKYVPSIESLINNTSDSQSKYATTDRTMVARLVVRDGQLPVGAISYEEITLNIDNSAGPFLVTYPTSLVYVNGNSNINITWNVAGTDNPNINVTNVNILLSTDGGTTFNTLLENTPNDGVESVLIPNTPSATARIKIESVGNIFYDISDENFVITDENASDFAIEFNQDVQSVYLENNASFDYSVFFLGLFNNAIDFEISGLPAGVTHNLPTQATTEFSNSTLTLSNLATMTAGYYPITITATENGTTNIKNIDLVLVKRSLGEPFAGNNMYQTNGYLRTPWQGMNTPEFTISLWVKPESVSLWRGLVSIGSFSITLRNNNVRFRYPTNDRPWESETPDGTINLDEWSHVAVV